MKFALIFAVIITLVGCKSEAGVLDTSGWISFEGSTYSVKYPKDWDMNTDGYMNTSFFITSPVDNGDKFGENVNLIIQDLTRFPMDLDEYTELSLSQIETLIPEGKLKKEERLHGPKYDYHSVLYSATMHDNRLMTAQYYWVIENDAYIITFTSLASEYEDYRETGYAIMNSLIIN